MATKIYSNPGIVRESLLLLSEAGRLFPKPLSRSSLERYIRQGVRGVRLETVLIGRLRYTSREAVDRFIQRQAETDDEQIQSNTKNSNGRFGGIVRYTHDEIKAKNEELGIC